MQIKVFTIPSAGNEPMESEVNKFLRSHRVLQTERHFCPEGGGYWALLIEYVDGDADLAQPAQRRERKDFRVELSDEEKKTLRYLREDSNGTG